MTHAVEEGPEEIAAVEKSGRMVQTGTQMRELAALHSREGNY